VKYSCAGCGALDGRSAAPISCDVTTSTWTRYGGSGSSRPARPRSTQQYSTSLQNCHAGSVRPITDRTKPEGLCSR